MNLTDYKISYIIVSANKTDANSVENYKRTEKLESILYAKEFSVQSIKGFCEDVWDDSFISNNEALSNQELKKEAMFLINEFGQDNIIIKYRNESNTKRLFKDGKEKPLLINIYDSNPKNKSYIIKGLSFSFTEQKEYVATTNKSDLKVGMIVEICNNNEWIERTIVDIDQEWENIYKLFAKHNKLRFQI